MKSVTSDSADVVISYKHALQHAYIVVFRRREYLIRNRFVTALRSAHNDVTASYGPSVGQWPSSTLRVGGCERRRQLSPSLSVSSLDINAVVRQYCRNTETKDQARMYQFMRDLIACRDWYDRDNGCILSRDELCDIINFFGC